MSKNNEVKIEKTVERKKCFIITPIGDELSPIRRHIEGIIDVAIAPALGDKYDIRVSHRIYEQGMITKQIIKEICKDELIIANITDRNPNVMYELALCHALGKPVIIIAEKNTSLPSDIIMQRTIFYVNDAQGTLELREELKKAEKELDFEQKTGPIIDVFKEINHDSILLEQVKTEKGDRIDKMEYIINRLNRIEDAIAVPNRREEHNVNKTYFLRKLTYNYRNIDRELSPNVLKGKLNKVLPFSFRGTEVVECTIDENENSISVDLLMSLPHKLKDINKEIISYFSAIGITGIEASVLFEW